MEKYNRKLGQYFLDKDEIYLLQDLAKERGGKCLSIEYFGSRKKLLFECLRKHRWEATPFSIKQGTWCPYCSNRVKSTLEEYKTIAANNNWECFSTEYKNNKTRLEFKCAFGHVWKAIPNNIKRGTTCPYCSRRKDILQTFINIATEHNGKCLSTNYINGKNKLRFQCSDGHTWEAYPSAMKSANNWCPLCRTHVFRSEIITRKIFEAAFNKEFPKSRPAWLIGERNSPLELDGYCRELNIAFEYQGQQHYTKVNYFNKDDKALLNQIRRDSIKSKLCEDNSVLLIKIKYFDISKSIKEIVKYVIDEIQKVYTIQVDISSIRIENIGSTRLELIKKIVTDRGGECLSNTYSGYMSKIQVRCKNNHIWDAIPRNILRGFWCPVCSHHIPLSLEVANKIARGHGGKCLSTEYKTVNNKLQWQCKEGHTWLAPLHGIKYYNHWCPHCSGRATNLDTYKKIAEQRGGKCLSTEYINCKTKLSFMCSLGHIWKANPGDIKGSNSWCPYCNNLQKKGRKYAKKIKKI